MDEGVAETGGDGDGEMEGGGVYVCACGGVEGHLFFFFYI